MCGGMVLHHRPRVVAAMLETVVLHAQVIVKRSQLQGCAKGGNESNGMCQTVTWQEKRELAAGTG